MTDFATGTVQANGLTFHTLEAGTGPIVLALHGFPDHARSYRHQMTALAGAGYRVVAPYLRGYAPTEIPENETVILAGGGLGNAVLFSIGQAMRRAGNRVLYFAAYKHMADRYKIPEIEAASDAVVWCCDEEPGFTPDRAQDKSFVGNIVQGMHKYASGDLGEQPIPFGAADRIIAIGSDRMMAAVARARHDLLRPWLKPGHLGIGSINSPMQCMMKEICAQCLQPHVDPQTGKVSYVFSCFNQDQPLDRVDWGALDARLRQNSVQEKLTAEWVDHCLVQLGARDMQRV